MSDTLSTHAGQHLPADHDAGDERTLGGYMAVHARPAAFEGLDGSSYSADILTDSTGDEQLPWGAYLFFVQWGRGEPEAVGHLETGFLVRGSSEEAVRRAAGQMSLVVVKATLDGLIRARSDRASSGLSNSARDEAGDEAGDGAIDNPSDGPSGRERAW